MRTTLPLAAAVLTMTTLLVQACGAEDDSTQLGGRAGQSAPGSDDASTTPTSTTTGTAPTGTPPVDTPDGGSTSTTDGGTPKPDAGKSTMTFFATSTGSGDNGGDLGGLAGADMKCQALAAAVGGGDHKWAAYLSTNTNNGGTKVDAKNRIGAGPWKNQKGVTIAASVAELHGAAFNLKKVDVLDEKGAEVPNAGPNRHDILTGTNKDGTATMTNCQNWTSKTAGVKSFMGHSDSETTANTEDRWHNAHEGNCDKTGIAGQGGEGRFYCFATD